MKLFIALVLASAIQAGLIAMRHFGELDTFWYVVLEVAAAPLCLVIIAFGFIVSLDWR